jgi:hypothetical protein
MGNASGVQVAAARSAEHASGARIDAAMRARGSEVSLEGANASFAMHATCRTTHAGQHTIAVIGRALRCNKKQM